MQRQALLLSSSNCHGYSMLEFAKQEICSFLKKKNVKDILFVPYAQKDYNGYTENLKNVLEPWGYNVTGIHTYPDPSTAVTNAEAIFVGGGNTFLLLKTLYDQKLVSLIGSKVHAGKLLYIGSSAGTNVATKSINTTNDMPIIYPPSFEGMKIIPFNLNPHYIEVENVNHKGETRDQRIGEYLEISNASFVFGLREGSILHVDGDKLTVGGVNGSVLFSKNGNKTEYPVGSDVSFLLNEK